MIPNFKQWIALKSLQELVGQPAPPDTITAVLGQAVGAQQPTNMANVADKLAKTQGPLALAIASNPVTDKLKALSAKNQAATNPTANNSSANNSSVPPNIGASIGSV
jgi:hypothetical protein